MTQIMFQLAADLVVLFHLCFILFSLAGGVLSFYEKKWAWVHIPTALWAGFVELSGWICPLTPLENWLRLRAGQAGYKGSFVEHYILPLIYPGAMTRTQQILLAIVVLLLNAFIYFAVFFLPRLPRRKP